MCGMLGCVGLGVDITKGLSWIKRRGPDAQRYWYSDDQKVALLHSRLAIVDLNSRADQPLTNTECGVTVALVGEIYNFKEIKRQFKSYQYRTASDTEAILAAYIEQGIQGLSFLKGMFTIIVVDERKRKVYLVRDSVGKKPLFYTTSNGKAVFGSSVLAVMAIADEKMNIDNEVLSHFWEHAFIQPWKTVSASIKPVAPGEWIELSWEGNIVTSGQCVPKPSLLYTGESQAETERTVMTLIAEAVAKRLENNPMPMTLLSGGIDSTVVTSEANKHLTANGEENVKCLTLGSLIPGTKDEFYARFAARKLNLPLEILRPSGKRLSDGILRSINVQDEPLGMPSYFLLHQLVESAAEHGRLLLTGDGGDEVFLGYKQPSEWKGQATEPSPNGVGSEPPFWMNNWARQVTGSTLLGHMMTKVDRASAEQGVEIRCPLLDWDLISYARSIPFSMLSGENKSKFLLKKNLSDWPNWFIERRKLGFAYNLRWNWAMTNFDALRDNIRNDAVDMFEHHTPNSLQKPVSKWGRVDVIKHFNSAWKLLVWSQFLDRFDRAQS